MDIRQVAAAVAEKVYELAIIRVPAWGHKITESVLAAPRAYHTCLKEWQHADTLDDMH